MTSQDVSDGLAKLDSQKKEKDEAKRLKAPRIKKNNIIHFFIFFFTQTLFNFIVDKNK